MEKDYMGTKGEEKRERMETKRDEQRNGEVSVNYISIPQWGGGSWNYNMQKKTKQNRGRIGKQYGFRVRGP